MVTLGGAAYIAQMTRFVSVSQMEELVVDVRPEFLQREENAVDGDVGDPTLVGFRERALLARVIQV